MTKSTITRERLEQLANFKGAPVTRQEEQELARMALAALDSEPDRNPVLAYADSYRDMAKQGVESVPIWSVITDLERNIAPLYRHAQQPVVVPNGLRLALSNAGIAAPESDEMLAATCEKHIQALVTWVKDRKPFQSAPVVPDGYVMVPKEPTDEMLAAAKEWTGLTSTAEVVYIKMLAAAPQEVKGE